MAVAAGFLSACGDDATGPETTALELELLAGSGQRGLPEWELTEPVVVRVRDGSGTPVQGVRVRFDVVAGGGTVTRTTDMTTFEGRASTGWSLGDGARTQRLRASLESGSVSLEVEATALEPEEADLLVVHGTLGELTGLVLVRDGPAGLDVVAARPIEDTLVHVPPVDAAGPEVVLFGSRNRPLRSAPAWTPGVDTVDLSMAPPVAVDIDIRVHTGAFSQQTVVMGRQLSAMENVWSDEGMGLVLGEVTFDDRTDPPREVHVSSAGICSGLSPGDAIQVNMVSSIDAGRYTGWGCWAGTVTMADGTESFPYLLAHELGHTFTLEHTATGLMYPSSPGTAVREGEIYRAHFHAQSVLNTIFESQPPALRRPCHVSVPAPACLPESLDLRSGPVTRIAAAEAAAALERGVGPHPVDAVRPGPVEAVGPGPGPARVRGPRGVGRRR